MSDRERTAAKKKITRRRDDDPVKIANDFRVSWYPGGVPGQGIKRRQQRCKSRDEAEAFAAEKYAEIDRHRSRGPLSQSSLSSGRTVLAGPSAAAGPPTLPRLPSVAPRNSRVGHGSVTIG